MNVTSPDAGPHPEEQTLPERPNETLEREEKIEQIVRHEVPSGYDEGIRIDRYITRFLPNVSRTKVQQGLKEGRVTVNGTVVDRVSHQVQAGDVIVCRLRRPPPIEARPEPIPLDIVFEDEFLLVVNKKAGLVVHPAYGNHTGTLVNALLHHVGSGTVNLEAADEEELEDEEVGLSTVNAAPERQGDPSVRPGIVHRLDKNTSGLLVVAKDDATHAALAQQFAERTIRRRYLALVWGTPDPPEGRIEGTIGRDPRDRKRMAVVRSGRGKSAVTHYQVVEPLAYTSLVAFRLESGRTHQIRVHAQYIRHPVFGDETYGGRSVRYGPNTGKRKAFFNNLFDHLNRQALHAESLGFTHPATGKALSFVSELPADMQYVFGRLRDVDTL